HPRSLRRALSDMVLDGGARCVRLDRLDPLLHRRGGRVHLALAQRLAVRRLENEVRLLPARLLALKAVTDLRIRLDRVYPGLGTGFGLVLLAAEDDLAVTGLETEEELTVRSLFNLELRSHESLRSSKW